MSDFDSPWKEAMDHYFAWFISFFFPTPHGDVDWARDYEVQDTELRKLSPDAEMGKRHADKLVKVYRRGNGDAVYLHVEVQSQREEGFERRIHVYNYRAEDRYNQPVVSLAVLGDDDPSWRPGPYVFELWGCRKVFEFRYVKLLDYAGREAELEANANPFALLVLTHLKALATRHDPRERSVWKLRLVKGLYERGLDADDVRQWFRFLDWLLDLPKDLERQVWQELARFEEEKRMTFITSVERIGFEKGWEKGLQEGRQEGIQEGRQEGIQQGRQEGIQQGIQQGREEGRREALLEGIELVLKVKFGAEGLRLMPDLQKQTDLAVLQKVFDAIEPATTPDELRRLLP